MDKPEEKKQCPFLDKPCIGEKCAIFMRVTQQQAIGTGRVVGMCALPALAMIMSSKQLPKESLLKLPHLKG